MDYVKSQVFCECLKVSGASPSMSRGDTFHHKFSGASQMAATYTNKQVSWWSAVYIITVIHLNIAPIVLDFCRQINV